MIKIERDSCPNCPLNAAQHVRYVGVPARRLDQVQALSAKDAEGVTALLVGEAPGENENYQGLPFVGASGKLLESALKSLGPRIDLSTVAVTNSVRCQPKDNKNPGVKIKRACLPYLIDEIEMFPNLEVIVTLGTQALTALMPHLKGGVTAHRLKVMEFEGLPLVATYHPAAVLYDRTKAPALQEDLHAHLVAKTWTSSDVKHWPSRLTNTVSEGSNLMDRLLVADEIGIDIETRSFSDNIISVGFYIPGNKKEE